MNAITARCGTSKTESDFSNCRLYESRAFVEKNPDTIVAYLKAWLEVEKEFKTNPGKVADAIYSFYTSKGYKLSKDTFAKALARVEVNVSWPADIKPYMTHQAQILLDAKKIKAIPDWNKALREDLLKKAGA